jgi:hypothetical protein
MWPQGNTSLFSGGGSSSAANAMVKRPLEEHRRMRLFGPSPLNCLALATVFAFAAIAPIQAEEPAAGVPKLPSYSGAQQASSALAAAKTIERLREGTRLTEVAGSFVAVGEDSITFSPAGSKDSYRVLENLALQRISQQLDENRGQRPWIVSGLITEFRGANYLLVTKAVVQLQDGDTASR